MKASLTNGLDKEAASDVKAAFISALPFRKRLIEVLEGKIDSKRKKVNKESVYEDPNFALKMADNMGYERCQREMILLLSEKS